MGREHREGVETRKDGGDKAGFGLFAYSTSLHTSLHTSSSVDLATVATVMSALPAGWDVGAGGVPGRLGLMHLQRS